jgi:hypothetical protein
MDKIEATKWLKSFIAEIDSQDNRATASPIQFLLQTKKEYVSHPDYGHRTRRIWRHPEMESNSCESFDEAVQWLVDYGYEGDKLEKEKESIEEFCMGHYWETQQCFLTKKGVEEHVRLNRHNLGEHRDYVVHSFRNPEMSELFNVIRELVK